MTSIGNSTPETSGEHGNKEIDMPLEGCSVMSALADKYQQFGNQAVVAKYATTELFRNPKELNGPFGPFMALLC